MAIASSNRRFSSSRIATLAAALLEASTLCAIATTDRRGRSYINTAYFAWTKELEIIWLSEPRAQHSKNLLANDSAAIAVFDSTQTWGNADRGIQLFGRAQPAVEDDEDARGVYAARFARFSSVDLRAYRLYRFRSERLKLFDEEALGGGGGTFVAARIGSDRKPVWQRTIVYQPKSG